MQDDGKQRIVDLEPIVVIDEPQPLELVHEEIHARPGRADHFRERRLRDLRDGLLRFVLLAVPCEQQERPGQPLFAGVEELVDEVFLDADVPRQHVSDEPIGQGVLLVQQVHHLILVHLEDGAARDRGRAPHPDGLTRQASFSKEIAGA